MADLEPIEAEENRWEALLRVTRSWRLEWNSSELLERVSREAVELLGLERGIVFLVEADKLHGRSAWPSSGVFDSVDFSTCQGIAERVVRTGRPVFAHEFAELGQRSTDLTGEVSVVLCVPLTSRQGILGALYVDAQRAPGSLTRRDHELLEMLGLQAAAALEHLLLYRSAITDPLTGLFSHRYFQQQVNQELRRARRIDGPSCVILLDLDGFKPLNDTCGHEAGNRYLAALAETLREVLRDSDVIARFGGDEFELLLPETDGEGGRLAAEKVRAAVEVIEFPEGPKVTCSLGVAAFPHNASDAQELFLRADEALYAAKEAGRNRTVVSARIEPPQPRSEEGRGRPRVRPRKPDLEETSWDLGLKPGIIKRPASAREHERIREQVDGHTVIKRLATGSTGEVLLVRQPELEREVALKRPHSARLTEEQTAAFEREARITARLQHPGVVPVHTMGADSDGRRYYTMRPMQDLSLGAILEHLARGEREYLLRYSQNALLEILQRVAETIAYAHSQKVTHGDLNPANVMVGEFGETVVIDWGEVAGGSSSGQGSPGHLTLLTGSPRYASPEQVEGRELGPAVDVHSMGAVLYEILTGKSPYLRSDTRATLEALRKGDVPPPEEAAPDRGADPVLSELSMSALSHNPATRPSAREFARRLGRYVRSEREWEVIKFGPGKRELVAGDWLTVMGEWELRGGEWISNGESDQILVLKMSVPGDFRFIAEGWIEEDGEISLIGHGPGITMANDFMDLTAHSTYRAYEGYAFQFGAEGNSCTKLARHGHDVQVMPGLCIEPGRKYRLELEYQDGWLRCFVDGRQVISYREMFPLAGTSVGFYAYGSGAHFRPLEVHRQNWALQPAMRMADDLYKHGFHDAAIERYVQIADRNPHRLEGDEARLKIGICMMAQNSSEGARRMFRSVDRGPMRPFALAEEAMMEFTENQGSDPRRGLAVLRELFEQHPQSQARFRIVEAAVRARHPDSKLRFAKDDRTGNLESFCELTLMAAKTYDPPMQSQIRAWLRGCSLLMQLGRYSEAVDESVKLSESTYVQQGIFYPIAYILSATALAAGRDDLLPLSHWQIDPQGVGWIDWTTSIGMHLAVRGLMAVSGNRDDLAAMIPKITKGLRAPSHISILLVAEVPDLAERALEILRAEPALSAPVDALRTTMPLVESGREELYGAGSTMLEELLATRATAEDKSNARSALAIYKARWALETIGDLDAAAKEMEAWRPPTNRFPQSDGFVLQVLLASLGKLESPWCTQLTATPERHLAGTTLDMARMFVGQKPPVPGELWPHPLWRTEWRLWLAIWLEQKGETKKALEVLRPARDPRYGLANNQPAIQRLLERLDG
jgi:diguanylate cyclase (GGDEF)-like protein